MDPVTHALAGTVLRNFGFSRPWALLTLVLFSVAPDLDYLTRLLGDEYFLRHHRGLTHGVPALLAVSFSVLVLVGPKKGGVYYASLAFAGYGLHILMDITNHYGVRLFAPLSDQTHALDLAFIFDPVFFGILLVGGGFGLFARERARAVSLVCLLLLVSYVGARKHYHDRALEFLREARKDYVVGSLSPIPTDLMRWWFVASHGDEQVVGFADLISETVFDHASYLPHLGNSAVDRTRRTPLVKGFLRMARHPHASVSESNGNTIVLWRELSYAYAPGNHVSVRLEVDREGRVMSQELRL
jgi:inner membrane protein